MRRWIQTLSCLLLVGSVAVTCLEAQVLEEQLRRVEAEKSKDPLYAQWTVREEGQETFQWGGWSALSFISLDNDDNSRAVPDAIRDVFINDQRLWGLVDFEDGTSLYARVRYLDFDLDLAPGVPRPRLSNERLDLDLGYLDFQPTDSLSFRVGRQYLRQGRGLTLNGNYDGVLMDWRKNAWTVTSFWAKNLPNDPDLDVLIDHPRRVFRALNLGYLAPSGEKYFAYYLGESDDSHQPSSVPEVLQHFRLDSEFYAIGSEGDFSQTLSYYGEGILQKGRQAALGGGGTDVDLDARAFMTEFVYHPKLFGQPTFSAEYAVASGDSGRLPGLSTLSGNGLAGRDRNFFGFGRYDGGLALNPRLSNLEVWRFGTTWKPWADDPGLEELTVGTKFSRYAKTDANGFVSDLQAIAAGDDLGTGLDLFLGWRALSDLSLVVQWGSFSPGKAYPVGFQDDAESLFVNLTYSF